MRDKTHSEFVEKWAEYCKDNMKECQNQVAVFINSQIENSNAFYERLAKTKNGRQKIAELRKK